MSYRALADRARRYARWALDRASPRAMSVCLLMPNQPDYLAIWLGDHPGGGVVALLNTSLVDHQLAHCMRFAAPAHMIVAASCGRPGRRAPRAARPRRFGFTGDARAAFPRVDLDLKWHSGEALSAAECCAAHARGPGAAYLHFRNHRAAQGGQRHPFAADAMEPLVRGPHAVLGRTIACTTVCRCITASAAWWRRAQCSSAADRSSFGRDSARSGFWNDVRRWDCTLFQYIGELCRYLLHTRARG